MPLPASTRSSGRGRGRTRRRPKSWGGAESGPLAEAPQTVTMKGGDYFFMPSLAFLKSL